MERLTTRSILGGWTLKVPRQEAVDRLAAYEETELEPEEIIGLCKMDRRAKIADLLRLEEYQSLGPVEELSALVKARDEGRVVVLEDVTVHQANTIIGMCERLNAMKARRGDDQEPLITWQLYNALLKSFTRAEAETAVGGGGDG